jgi:hypothetical protein
MKKLDILASLILAFFAIVTVVWSVWTLYPYKTIKFNDPVLPILNENHQVKSGGYLLIKLDYCKYTNEIPLVSRTFADGVLYDVAPTPVSQKPIGCAIITLQIYVPKGLPLGEYTLKNTYHYKPNPVRTVNIAIDTEKFTIVK